ncbi:DUF4374 domain-containing protein [Sphingobacterium psychroaquaticum]|uniref:DUF4374 domain-containing protein n=1 Tax=Sphingobacterium psychroaquaticum TaxID=561061 RepID=A0A1X7HV55_9SPHI|nr:DUF4374 domain-containing protein [Sphingobacterium psychroaquaticum]SMG05874.1 protein of unknown function [Sphingobacterium psychroaquaticum]
MHINTIKKAIVLVTMFSMGYSLQSCKKSDSPDTPEPETEKVFAVGGMVMEPDGSYIFQTGNLTGGEISFVGKGANVTNQEPGFLAFITKSGFYYSYLSSENTLTKYSYVNQTMQTVKAIPFVLEDGYRYNHQWIDNNTLLIYAYQGDYKIVNVESMTVTKEGKFNLPTKAGLTGPIVGFAEVKDNKLHVGYWYGDEKYPTAVAPGKQNYATGTAYFAVFDYPSLSNPVYSEDNRSTSPGNDRNGVLKTFTYNDDLYIVTSPFEMVAQNWDKPHGIYRIKKGTSVVDPTYFLNLSEKLNGDVVLGGGYAGNGKLLIRRIRMDLALTWGSYGFANVQEFHVVDMASGSITKLNVPLAKSQPTAPNILADEGKVYFPVNTKDIDGNFFLYNYDSTTGLVNKGVQIKDVDAVNGLFRLK